METQTETPVATNGVAADVKVEPSVTTVDLPETEETQR